MKITHFVWSFNTGGIETMLIDITACQASQGHDVRLVVINTDYDPTLLAKVAPKVRVTLMHRTPGGRNPWFLAEINILAMKSDVVHCHQANMIPLFAPWTHRKIVLTVHSILNSIGRIPSRIRVVAISCEVANYIKESNHKSRTSIVPNGLPCHLIPFTDHTNFDTSSQFRIVQVARLKSSYKRQDLLIEAIAALRCQGISNVSVDFIGEGESEHELRELARALGVDRQVNFLGCRTREYIYSHLADYHLMVHSMRQEGFGLSVAEAMVAGLPVLVPDSGALCSLTCGSTLGSTFKSDDAQACAAAISSIMNHYDSALAKIRAARLHILNNFTIQRQVEEYLRIYRGA